jgi:hypothetical protein
VAILAGVMFGTSEALTRVVPDAKEACDSGLAYLVNIADLLKYGGMGVAVLILVGECGDRIPRSGRVVGRLAGAGSIVAGVANGIEHCAHLETLGIIYVLGLLIGLLGTIVFGVFLARSGVFVPWIGWVISGGVLAFLLAGQQGGAALASVAWVVVGIRLVVGNAAQTTGVGEP